MTDTVQATLGSWWEPSPEHPIARGQLIRAFVPHVDQVPLTITEEARTEPTEHGKAKLTVGPLSIKDWKKKGALPVAALPLNDGETRTVHRAKARPCVVVASRGSAIAPLLRSSGAKWQTAPTLLVAPYYGVAQTPTRAGWNPTFVNRIRACEYPQYVLDSLPIGQRQTESVLRLDHIQPIGDHHDSFEPLPIGSLPMLCSCSTNGSTGFFLVG